MKAFLLSSYALKLATTTLVLLACCSQPLAIRAEHEATDGTRDSQVKRPHNGSTSEVLPPAPEQDDEQPNLQTLVDGLGAKSFSQREAAMRALFEIGLPAVPTLREVLEHQDREVRLRAKRAIAEISRRDRPRRLTALISSSSNCENDQFGFPCRDTYINVVGESQESTRLFARALRNDWDLLEFAHQAGENCFDAVESRCAALRQLNTDKVIPGCGRGSSDCDA